MSDPTRATADDATVADPVLLVAANTDNINPTVTVPIPVSAAPVTATASIANSKYTGVDGSPDTAVFTNACYEFAPINNKWLDSGVDTLAETLDYDMATLATNDSTCGPSGSPQMMLLLLINLLHSLLQRQSLI